MKIGLLSLAAVLVLTACGAATAPGTPGNTGDDGDDTAINETAGLNAYPGSTAISVVPAGLDTRTTFTADATLDEVYRHFDGQLTAQGWQQTAIERDDGEIEAEYVREDRELEFELERDDGGFELELDIDGDNADYDADDGDDDSDDGVGDDD